MDNFIVALKIWAKYIKSSIRCPECGIKITVEDLGGHLGRIHKKGNGEIFAIGLKLGFDLMESLGFLVN